MIQDKAGGAEVWNKNSLKNNSCYCSLFVFIRDTQQCPELGKKTDLNYTLARRPHALLANHPSHFPIFFLYIMSIFKDRNNKRDKGRFLTLPQSQLMLNQQQKHALIWTTWCLLKSYIMQNRSSFRKCHILSIKTAMYIKSSFVLFLCS